MLWRVDTFQAGRTVEPSIPGLNGAIGTSRYADTVTVAFCRIYRSLAVYEGYGFLRAGFNAFAGTSAFFLINDYFHCSFLSRKDFNLQDRAGEAHAPRKHRAR